VCGVGVAYGAQVAGQIISLHLQKIIYSQICLKRSPKGQKNSGRIRQTAV
jgi:hypothetical protein